VSDDNELPDVPARPVAKRKRGRPRKEPLSKAAKTKETCASSKANATIYLLEAQKHLRPKDKQAGKAGSETAASPYSCWVHQHWKLSEVGEYGEEVTPENFAKLQIVKPVMVCKHCSKTMSWAPSTNRKKHLCLTCKEFAATDAFKRPEVQQDVANYKKKIAASRSVCCSNFQCSAISCMAAVCDQEIIQGDLAYISVPCGVQGSLIDDHMLPVFKPNKAQLNIADELLTRALLEHNVAPWFLESRAFKAYTRHISRGAYSAPSRHNFLQQV
jgi:hypothetical protein